MRRKILPVLSILAALLVAATAFAQGPRLLIGGTQSNFGRRELRGGFMPDPFTAPVTSGGNIDVAPMSLAPGCRGFVTRQPDFILQYDAPASFLRIYFAGAGDTTLVINDGSNRWHCNDDSYGGVNPTVDINRPARGQYDIWVGSYRSGEAIRGTLHITEMRTQHP